MQVLATEKNVQNTRMGKEMTKCRGSNTSTWRLSDHCVPATGTHLPTFSNHNTRLDVHFVFAVVYVYRTIQHSLPVDSSVLFDILGRTVCLTIGNHASGNKLFGQSLKICPIKIRKKLPILPSSSSSGCCCYAHKQRAMDMPLYGGEISPPSRNQGFSFDPLREKRTAWLHYISAV